MIKGYQSEDAHRALRMKDVDNRETSILGISNPLFQKGTIHGN
jgi:hypothetical protein